MPSATAQLRLQMMTAAATDPYLTIDEIDLLLDMYKVRDAAGSIPSNVAWVESYDYYAAATEGWRWKAGKASDLGNMRTGDLTIEDNPVYEHCIKQILEYQRLCSYSAQPLTRDFHPQVAS